MRIPWPNSMRLERLTHRERSTHLVRLTVLALAALLAAACATTPPAQDEARVTELIDVINAGPIEAVVDQSSVPFLFDAELLVREGDIEFLWQGLRDAGVVFSPAFAAMIPVEPSDYRRVADTFDVKTFFAAGGHLPSDATWIETDSTIGPVLLILGGRSGQLPLVHGIVRVDR